MSKARMVCPHCAKKIAFNAAKVGRFANCPGCGRRIVLQAAEPTVKPNQIIDALTSAPRSTESRRPSQFRHSAWFDQGAALVVAVGLIAIAWQSYFAPTKPAASTATATLETTQPELLVATPAASDSAPAPSAPTIPAPTAIPASPQSWMSWLLWKILTALAWICLIVVAAVLLLWLGAIAIGIGVVVLVVWALIQGILWIVF